MTAHLRLGFMLCAALLAACGGDEGGGGEGGGPAGGMTASDPTCASGKRWTGGDEESALMHPGGACISCHQQQGEGPVFRVAGTVYESAAEKADCFGFTGAQVVVTGSDGQSVTLDTNSAGNFMHEGALTLPLKVKVVHDGKTREMISPVSDGDCNSCHDETGQQGAPGRILLP